MNDSDDSLVVDCYHFAHRWGFVRNQWTPLIRPCYHSRYIFKSAGQYLSGRRRRIYLSQINIHVYLYSYNWTYHWAIEAQQVISSSASTFQLLQVVQSWCTGQNRLGVDRYSQNFFRTLGPAPLYFVTAVRIEKKLEWRPYQNVKKVWRYGHSFRH